MSRNRRQDLCDRERQCLKICYAILCLFLRDFRASNHCLKGPQKPKAYCDKKRFAVLSFTSVSTVRSGALWQQDLAILSPGGFRDSTFQLWLGSARQRVLSAVLIFKL